MNPQLPPMPQDEAISGPEITEVVDPTPSEEAALIKIQNQMDDDNENGEEEGEGEEEQDGEDD